MDNRQYRQIVDDYADMVYRIALQPDARRARCRGRGAGGVLEVLRETAGMVLRRPERNGGRAMAAVPERETARDERLRAWLIRVTVNECKSLLAESVAPASGAVGHSMAMPSLRGARVRRAVPRGAVRGAGALREMPHRGAPVLLRGHGYSPDRRGAGHEGTHGAHPARPSKEVTEAVIEGGVGR